MCLELLDHLVERSPDSSNLTFMVPDDLVAFNPTVQPSVHGFGRNETQASADDKGKYDRERDLLILILFHKVVSQPVF